MNNRKVYFFVFLAVLALLYFLVISSRSGIVGVDLQILTSLPSNESIDYFQVEHEGGEVLRRDSNFVNRALTLDLEMGKTYRISAGARASARSGGVVHFSTEVTVTAEVQSIELDLREAYAVQFSQSEEGRSIFVLIRRSIVVDSRATRLYFAGGDYYTNAIPIEVASLHFGNDTFQWSEGGVVVLPDVFSEGIFDFALLEIQHHRRSSEKYDFISGEFSLSWQDEFSQLTQRFEVLIPL